MCAAALARTRPGHFGFGAASAGCAAPYARVLMRRIPHTAHSKQHHAAVWHTMYDDVFVPHCYVDSFSSADVGIHGH